MDHLTHASIKPCRLSVNINKIATLRNARGGQIPDLIKAAKDIEHFGAEGITVHPRPDERHIRYDDVAQLKQVVQTEFNIEGYPSASFVNLVMQIKPHQVTLVPDAPDVLTSNAGWNVLAEKSLLSDVIAQFKEQGIRVSLFMDTDLKQIESAASVGANRIELYTEHYARNFKLNAAEVVVPYQKAAQHAEMLTLGVNAGHDLNLENLRYLIHHVPQIIEVSIGHALISDALYYGLHNTIQMYKYQLLLARS
jgi:pyridoxine 5-phosphate synthase